MALKPTPARSLAASPKAASIVKNAAKSAVTAVKAASEKPSNLPGARGAGGFAAKPLTAAQQKIKDAETARRKALVRFPVNEGHPTTTFMVDSYFGHDGLTFPRGKIEVIRGRWNNPEAKRVDMNLYAPEAVMALFARMGMVLHSTSTDMKKRMPVNSRFQSYWAASRRKDGTLFVSLRDVQRGYFSKKEGWSFESIAKSEDEGDVVLMRRFKRCKVHMIGAAAGLKPLPTVAEFKQLAKAQLGHDVL